MKYMNAVLSDPAMLGGVLDAGEPLRDIAVAGMLWLTVFWLLTKITHYLFFNTPLGRRCFSQLNAAQRESFVVWVIELVFSTIAFVLLWVFAGPILVSGAFHRSRVEDSPELDWNKELAWVGEARGFMDLWAWGAQPYVFYYILQVISASPLRQTSSSHYLLTAHHFVVVLMMVLGLRATQTTLNPRWAQMGLSSFLHCTCEQDAWILLIWYRLKLPLYPYVATACVVIESIKRLIIWGWSLYVYAELCWMPCTLTSWEVVWRGAFPPLAVLLIFAQTATVRIHILLMLKAWKRYRADRAKQQGSPLSAATDRANEPIGNHTTEEEGTSMSPLGTSQLQLIPAAGSIIEGAASSVSTIPAPLSVRRDSDSVAVDISDEKGRISSPGGNLNALHRSNSRNEPLETSTTTAPSQQQRQPTPAPQTTPQAEEDDDEHQKGTNARGTNQNQPRSSPLVNPVAIPGYTLAVLSIIVIALLYGVEVIPLDASVAEVRCKNIAVVGGGAAGLSAMWALQRDENQFSVTLFERSSRFGGALHSTTVNGTILDHAVHATWEYHNLYAFMDALGVNTTYVQTTLSLVDVRNDSSRKLYAHPGTVPRDLYKNSSFYSFEGEIRKLQNLQVMLENSMTESELMTTTLGQMLERWNFSADFRYVYIHSCTQAYVAASVTLFDMPLALYFYLENVFHVCQSISRVPYRTFANGSSSFVDAIVKDAKRNSRVQLRASTEVLAVQRLPRNRVKLLVMSGTGALPRWEEFDQVVFAVFRRDAYKILTHPASSALEAPKLYAAALSNVRYENMTTVAHNDSALAATRLAGFRDSDGCWNVERYAVFSNRTNNSAILFPTNFESYSSCVTSFPSQMLTVYGERRVPTLLPSPDSVIEVNHWMHPSHDSDFYAAARNLHALQGAGGVWFAGADQVLNLNEHAIVSGLVAANALGAAYPFDKQSLARLNFLRVRGWLLHGLQFLLPPTVTHRNQTSRCASCL